MIINDLRPGIVFEFEGQPWKVLKTTHVHMGRGSAVVQAKIKNLISGKVQDRAFRPRDEVKEADIETKPMLYLYSHRGEYWFCEKDSRSNRFSLKEEIIGNMAKFLKQNAEVEALVFKGETTAIEVPIKMQFRVVQAPPAVKGDTQGTVTKLVKIETGAYVNAPIFVKEGDMIVVNTETGEYVERA
ncbi:MAG: elongation factor P [Candidatus Portnoybacteria bacterium]|nr:elongation factor P [Candidatus Portnoybacteria bacterium]